VQVAGLAIHHRMQKFINEDRAHCNNFPRSKMLKKLPNRLLILQ
jgi:hypothetical protein